MQQDKQKSQSYVTFTIALVMIFSAHTFNGISPVLAR
jgi:hypothetical protein